MVAGIRITKEGKWVTWCPNMLRKAELSLANSRRNQNPLPVAQVELRDTGASAFLHSRSNTGQIHLWRRRIFAPLQMSRKEGCICLFFFFAFRKRKREEKSVHFLNVCHRSVTTRIIIRPLLGENSNSSSHYGVFYIALQNVPKCSIRNTAFNLHCLLWKELLERTQECQEANFTFIISWEMAQPVHYLHLPVKTPQL